MTYSRFCRARVLPLLSLVFVALVVSAPATAQTTSSVPLTPAQQKAEAAKEARLAAQQQAAQKRAEAAQARAAAKNKTTSPGAAPASTNPARSTAASPNTNADNPAAAATKAGGSDTVGSGTLAWQTRVYRSTGCVHDGNTAMCTFTFANQGNAATLIAASEMAGLQLVDDAHVPHRGVSAHFLDKYGTQQPRLVVQPGDTGTFVVSFANVNSQVTTGDFHLRQQIVGGVTFSNEASGTKSETDRAHAPVKTTNK